MDTYPDCTHQSTTLTEEGYECLDCGLVLGHSWGSLPRLKDRAADLRSRINEDDGPARWFLNARREYRAVDLRIKALEEAKRDTFQTPNGLTIEVGRGWHRVVNK